MGIRILALSVALLIFSTQADALPLLMNPWRKGAWQFSNETSYFTSSANYLERGVYDDLPNGNSFTATQSDFAGRYHLSRTFSAYTGLSIARVSSSASGLVRENANLTTLFFGSDIALMRKPLFLAAEVEGALSLDSVEPSTDEALTSDGAHSFAGRLIASKKLSWLEIFGTLGAKYRTESLATLLTWSLGAQKPLGNIDLGFGLSGFESLTGDGKPAAERVLVTSRVNAGSLRYYAHDPALMEMRGWINWMLSRAWSLNFAVSQTINGTNSAAGTMGTIGLVWSIPPKKSTPIVGNKTMLDEFEVDTKEVDPKLFKEDD